MNIDTWDVIVIGGGAAGLSAALQLGRARRNTLVVDSGLPRNRFASSMHGILGHDGIDPAELVGRGRQEVARYGVTVHEGSVIGATQADQFRVTLEDGGEHAARRLIVTTGLRDELPDIDGIELRWGIDVVMCPYCEGYEVRDRRIGVIGVTPLSQHQVQLVRQWSENVTFFTHQLTALDPDVRDALDVRDVAVETTPVTKVRVANDALAGVELADGRQVELDALFVASTPIPNDGFLTGLGLDYTDTPAGRFPAVDATGKTSIDGVWAAGNVTNPAAVVSAAIASGAAAAGAVNMDLVVEDTELARARRRGERNHEAPAAVEFWEGMYRERDHRWSPNPNQGLVTETADLAPGTAVDLGCGEGADAIWLAERGWTVTAIDISPTALGRAAKQASAVGVAERIGWVETDLGEWSPTEHYDLVSTHFLHSPAALPQLDVLRTARDATAAGGTLLVVGHAEMPPWANIPAGETPDLPQPEDILAELALDQREWTVETAEVRARSAQGPDGSAGTLYDAVVKARRG